MVGTMKLNIISVCLTLCLLFSVPACSGSIRGPYIANPPTVGTIEPFYVTIYNGTQWELDLGTFGPGHVILPRGSSITFDIGFLPASVTVQAITTSVPQYIYPAQTKIFNLDYGPYDTAISFGIY